MRNASAQMIALLNGNNTYLIADLYTVSLLTGETHRWNTGDTDLTLDGEVFRHTGPIIERDRIRLKTGLEVDVLNVTLKTGDSPQAGIDNHIQGHTLPAAATNGAFDGARVKVQKVYMPTWGDTSPGALLMFEGAVAAVDPSRHQVQLTVKSELDKLNQPMPRTLLKPGCSYSVYDAGCGLSRSALTVTGTINTGSTRQVIKSGLGQASQYFDLGVLAITSGPAAGSRRAVRAYAGGDFTLSMPLGVAPQSGDSFTVYPGCYRTRPACAAKNNSNRFRGYPYVPVPEQAR
ncbi:DUF2163 domain-containing protein [Microbulbifer sp. 2205BS26-8]|uniref:DUF2163 domain-containing protein n=1 Tax=Microbulbifer sp. 2205BS26-8 TaxID=3064386 RepID=UPI00273D20CA|nr:DUF2163 domain-containing protein [Microbulbifer sp. 2205BS26-8]MDP5209990.1 DUF2163 domain-containing protein [Microbulbifer sp. 2205BS26-8]